MMPTTPDPLEIIQAMIPGSRTGMMRLEDDPVIPPWCAYILWHDKGPKDITVGGYSKREALVALREAVKKYLTTAPKPLEDDPEERAAIQGEPRRKDDF